MWRHLCFYLKLERLAVSENEKYNIFKRVFKSQISTLKCFLSSETITLVTAKEYTEFKAVGYLHEMA